ncbi:lipopolysaccharide 1,3-galactosyltransferase [Escherichia coli]|uniref:lipopolysaccharide 1,3-galactosyltransferase n=1 Tax=Escherichia coli TaxID=562 RepID=UPI003EBAE387
MKIAFIGEAVSGFGGMETVIRDVITTFRQQHIQSEMFSFVVMTKWIRMAGRY